MKLSLAIYSLFLFLYPILTTAQSTLQPQSFQPGIISLPDIRETSPSVTTDGQTMVFARTESWKDKFPFIAHRSDDSWATESLPIADTLYNLAISPDGRTLFMKKYEPLNGEEISRAYRLQRTAKGWSAPVEMENLYNINAGYFCPLKDGTLYLFARKPRPGIYRSEPDRNGRYGQPQWLSDAFGIDSTTHFDVLMHPSEERLIITRSVWAKAPTKEQGDDGFYYYEKTGDRWRAVKRLPLPYGWGATVLPDGRFLFVNDGDLQTVPLEELGIDWPAVDY